VRRVVGGLIALLSGAAALGQAEPTDLVRTPAEIEVVTDVVYATAQDRDGADVELLMDVAFPRTTDDALAPVVLYFHPGAWQQGSRTDGRDLIELLARGGYVAASIDYRLVSTAPFPAAIEDGNAAIRFVRGNAEELGIDPERIGVAGHSAGGHLAAILGTSGNLGPFSRAVEAPRVAATVRCAVSISGPMALDQPVFTDEAQAIIDTWLEAEDAREHRRLARQASPVSYVDGDDPPCLLIHGADDPLVPLSQPERFRRSMDRAGAPVELHVIEGAGHGVTTAEAHRLAIVFLDRHLEGDATAVFDADVASAAPPDAPPDAPPGAPQRDADYDASETSDDTETHGDDER